MAQGLISVAVLVLCVQLATATFYCGSPDPLRYGTIRPQQRTYPVGDTVEFSCNKGFVLVGQRWTVCVLNPKTRRASWAHPTPVCKRIVTCPELDEPRYGTVRVSGNRPGDRADYKCNSGFTLVGASWRKCQNNGQWTGKAPICRPITCPDLDAPKYGSVRVSGNRPGDRADYKCNSGFTLVGVSWRKCQDSGQWTGKAPTCRPITCPDLDAPKYGSVRVSGNRPGDRADYKCNSGFTLVGVSWRKCQDNGKWTGSAPTCRPITCPDLDAPKYGSVRVSGNRPGDRADYKCNSGFTLVGVSWRKCQDSGQWTGKAPTCRPITCPDLDAPKYGSVRVSGNRPGARADYKCNSRFTLVGVSWRKCQDNGKWTGSAPTCRRVVDCGKPPSVRYGRVRFSRTTENSKAIYVCRRGFFLRGNRVRVCQANSDWSGKTPVCFRKHH